MKDDKIDSISSDLEFVKSAVQETSVRMTNLEKSMLDFHKDFSEHIINDQHMAKELIKISHTLEKNTDSLIEHMRRTHLNEANIDELKNISEKISTRLQPLEEAQIEKKAMLKILTKIGALLGGLIGLASLMYEILSK